MVKYVTINAEKKLSDNYNPERKYLSRNMHSRNGDSAELGRKEDSINNRMDDSIKLSNFVGVPYREINCDLTFVNAYSNQFKEFFPGNQVTKKGQLHSASQCEDKLDSPLLSIDHLYSQQLIECEDRRKQSQEDLLTDLWTETMRSSTVIILDEHALKIDFAKIDIGEFSWFTSEHETFPHEVPFTDTKTVGIQSILVEEGTFLLAVMEILMTVEMLDSVTSSEVSDVENDADDEDLTTNQLPQAKYTPKSRATLKYRMTTLPSKPQASPDPFYVMKIMTCTEKTGYSGSMSDSESSDNGQKSPVCHRTLKKVYFIRVEHAHNEHQGKLEFVVEISDSGSSSEASDVKYDADDENQPNNNLFQTKCTTKSRATPMYRMTTMYVPSSKPKAMPGQFHVNKPLTISQFVAHMEKTGYSASSDLESSDNEEKTHVCHRPLRRVRFMQLHRAECAHNECQGKLEFVVEISDSGSSSEASDVKYDADDEDQPNNNLFQTKCTTKSRATPMYRMTTMYVLSSKPKAMPGQFHVNKPLTISQFVARTEKTGYSASSDLESSDNGEKTHVHRRPLRRVRFMRLHRAECAHNERQGKLDYDLFVDMKQESEIDTSLWL